MVTMGQSRPLRPGDVVEVRSAAEILASLDGQASLKAMPFMPEMLKHVGKRFTVLRRVEKICATAGGASPSRRMRSRVFLDDLRCDGSAHDGCQAGCRLYWDEEWLRRIDGEFECSESNISDLAELEALSQSATRATRELDGLRVETYRCQATEALAASEPLSPYDPMQYVREVTSRNVGLLHLVRVLGRVLCFKVLKMLRLRAQSGLPPRPESTQSSEILSLRPGDLVQVRSREEIAATLDEHGRNRGLWFDDSEMIVHCGRTHRVQDRVNKFIEDKTGQMVELSSDAVILEGVFCGGECSKWRWFCPRGIYPFWREAWLRQVKDPESDVPGGIDAAGSDRAEPRRERGSP
jgi:hypothetical protein